MLLLVLTNLTTYAHTLCQQIHQLIVKLVNLLTQLCNTLGSGLLITDYQQTQDVVQNIRSYLLLSITPSLVRIAVTLNNQSVETKVHSLLTKWSYQLTTTTDVTWVADDWQLWYTATQLDRNLPHWGITVNLLLVARETAMYCSQTLDTSLIQTLKSTNPKLQIRVYRVLNENRNVYALQRVGNSLHCKWVS